MAITVSEGSVETMSRLIRAEFEKIDFSMEYIYGKADSLIKTARDFGLEDLANEMELDKQIA